MKICFLDNSEISYTSLDLLSNKIRGAENILINLSNEFSKLNHEVTIYNNCKNNIKIGNINWINLKKINDNPHFDLAISNNDIRLFDKISASKKIAISHSIQTIEKFIRKKQFYAFIKKKPKIALLSNYHKEKRNFLLRFFGSFKTSWSIDKIFINTKITNSVNSNQAIFTSNKDRNLNILIHIWKNKIFPINKNKKLLITPIKDNLINFNIFNRDFGDKINLIKDIQDSRIYLIPGHKAELYCLAAEEARELCIPIVTLGIGCLNERVEHGKTGFIAKNEDEFVDYTHILFNDNNLWSEIRKNLISLRGSNQWKDTAIKFLKNADF